MNSLKIKEIKKLLIDSGYFEEISDGYILRVTMARFIFFTIKDKLWYHSERSIATQPLKLEEVLQLLPDECRKFIISNVDLF